MKKSYIAFVLAVILILLGINWYVWFMLDTVQPEPIEMVPDGLDHWIEELADVENCGQEGIIDVNGERSYGDLCFQEKTFRHFVEKFSQLRNAEEAEIMNFISDSEFQRKLARKMIIHRHRNWRHWLTSVIYKIGKPPKNNG